MPGLRKYTAAEAHVDAPLQDFSVAYLQGVEGLPRTLANEIDAERAEIERQHPPGHWESSVAKAKGRCTSAETCASIKNKRIYISLTRKHGMDKSKAAAISNAMFNGTWRPGKGKRYTG